eukprot:gene8165-16782_t
MAWRCTSSTNEGLVKNLQNTGLLKTEKAVSAMRSVDRKNYAPMTPYHDSPQSIGFGQTISAPHMHATVLEDLANEIQRPDSRILDVGCGSGYLTAVFARMNPTATVCGIDYIDELVDLSKRNIQRTDNDLLESKRVVLDTRDGWHGWPEYAPFDAIHVGAAATDLPRDLLDQLKTNVLSSWAPQRVVFEFLISSVRRLRGGFLLLNLCMLRLQITRGRRAIYPAEAVPSGCCEYFVSCNELWKFNISCLQLKWLVSLLVYDKWVVIKVVVREDLFDEVFQVDFVA